MNTATINNVVFPLSPITAIEVAARSVGLHDVDVENTPDSFVVKASGSGLTLSARGATLEEAAEKFVKRVVDSKGA